MRDPRTDPQPGDRIRVRASQVLLVTKRHPSSVDYTIENIGTRCFSHIDHWCTTVRDGEVLYASLVQFNSPPAWPSESVSKSRHEVRS
jgi:hypothetical protein